MSNFSGSYQSARLPFLCVAKGSGTAAPPFALVASRWGQDLTRKSLATLRQCQTPVRGGFPGDRTWCEAVSRCEAVFWGIMVTGAK